METIADSVAEWLRRWIANPLLFERAGSNPATVAETFLPYCRVSSWYQFHFVWLGVEAKILEAVCFFGSF